METKAHHIVIGFFTVFVFAGILLFSAWLADASSDNEFNYYDVIFNESVDGLSKGSAVQYSGIQVGEVISLNLDKNNLNKVCARIRVNAAIPIKKDIQAVLAVRGITGNAYIQFSKGSPDSENLVSTNNDIPIIIATPSALTKIINHGEGLMTNINQSLIQINKALSEDNIVHLNNIIKNIDQITSTINNHNGDIDTMLVNLAESSKQIKTITVTANQQSGQLLKKANNLLDAIAKNNTLVSSLLKNNYNSVNNGLQSLSNIEPILRELHITLRRLNNITRKLEESPANYLLESEKRKEYIPK